MKEQYLLADQTIGNDDIQTLIGWLQTNPWLTQGSLVKEFESKWAKWLDVKYATFVNSGSSANLLMYYSLLLSGRLKNKKVKNQKLLPQRRQLIEPNKKEEIKIRLEIYP